MPFAEWAKLERLSARIEELHHHRLYSEKIGDFARALEIAREIIVVEAQHNHLVDQVMARLAVA